MAKQKKSKATDVDSDNLVNEEVEVEVVVEVVGAVESVQRRMFVLINPKN